MVCSAFRSGPLPCQLPPTSTVPPPAAPDASTSAPLSSMTRLPRTEACPPRSPVPRPDTSTKPSTRVMPSSPPSITTRPWRMPTLRACTMPLTLSTVSANAPRAAARRSTVPPSAWMRPSCCRRLLASVALAWKKIRPSPSTSTSTLLAAAMPMRPPVASMLPLLVTEGATSATVPPWAVMLPWLITAPRARSPSLVRLMRPARKSLLDRLRLDASRLPTSTRAPAPNTTP